MQVMRCANPDLPSNLPAVLGKGREGDDVVEMQSQHSVKYSQQVNERLHKFSNRAFIEGDGKRAAPSA
jgi:hypothetical protein